METQSVAFLICNWNALGFRCRTLYGPVYGGVSGGLEESIRTKTCDDVWRSGGVYRFFVSRYVCLQVSRGRVF